jgi:hypothetical protein
MSGGGVVKKLVAAVFLLSVLLFSLFVLLGERGHGRDRSQWPATSTFGNRRSR